MTPRKKPVAEEPADTEADLEQKSESKAERGDPWEEPCPVCGLKGCTRHV